MQLEPWLAGTLVGPSPEPQVARLKKGTEDVCVCGGAGCRVKVQMDTCEGGE